MLSMDINEGDGEVEEEPDVDHLDVGGDRKASNNGDEHAGEDQHDGEVDSDSRFKIKGFEVVSDVSNNIEEDRRNINSSENTEKTSAKVNRC